MTLRLLSVVAALCLLAGCAHFVRDDSAASDLDALQASVDQEMHPRTLASGKEYCAEDAKTEEAQDQCLGDLEDLVFTLNRSMERGAELVKKGLERIRSSQHPCGWLDFSCKRRKRSLDDPPSTKGGYLK